MFRIGKFGLVTAALAALVTFPAVADVAVTNVIASQRTDGTGKVDVYYNLSGATGPCYVTLVLSNDNGVNWNVVPIAGLLQGDIGPNVTNGANKHIVWDAPRDRANVSWPAARARVTASDANGLLPLTLPGGVALEMVRIPAGSFMMGSPDDAGYTQADEQPQHMVTIAQDFYMSKYELTVGQYYAINGGSSNQDPMLPFSGYGYATNLLLNLNKLGMGNFRLPSEAEWEYACRGGITTRWSFGNNVDNLGSYCWYSGNATSLNIVGNKSPNPYGLFDMHGNTYEVVGDSYHADYVGAPTDGSVWGGGTSYYLLRGGSLNSSAAQTRSAARLENRTGFSYGLRLYRAL